MGISTLPFSRLRELLLNLDFAEKSETAARKVFEHRESETVFLFRNYKFTENISLADLFSVRKQLDERGILPANSFDQMLVKTPA